MSAPECRRLGSRLMPEAKRQTCIEALADGWITSSDLCASCTRVFMTALDGISGPLRWHQAYHERAMA